MADSYLGLDLGTSGLKVALWSDDGELLAQAEAAYPVEHPRAGWAQTPVQRWYDALVEAVERIAPPLRSHRVAAIGVDGQMHGLVLTDDRGGAVGPAVLWSDGRATGLMPRWRALPEGMRARLANPLVPGMTGPLLAWSAKHDRDLMRRAAVALLPKDAFRNFLVPSPVTDRSDASATLLWDIPADDWARDVVDELGLPGHVLPEVVASTQVVGSTDWLRDVVGAAGDVPVVVGAGDTPAARLAVASGQRIQINLGSGGQALVPIALPAPAVDPVTHTYADTGSGWYRMAAVQNAGLALDWTCRMLCMSWEDLFAAAEAAAPGARGVSFLPFLQGERGGVAGPDARAGWVGASAGTTREDLARSAVEGMVFTMRLATDLLEPTDVNEPVVLTGGGGRSAVVQQLLANILRRPVHRQNVRSASATGAALLGAAGIGHSFAPQHGPPVVVDPTAPGTDLESAYDRWLDLLDRLGGRSTGG